MTEREKPIEPKKIEYLYGFNKDSIDLFQSKIQKNQVLGTLLSQNGIKYQQILNVCAKAKGEFDVRNVRVGKPYSFISFDSCQTPEVFIYEPDVYKYMVFDMRNQTSFKIVHRPIDTVLATGSGIVLGSLWLSMDRQGLSPSLIDRMEDALAWSVDFYHIQNGNRFKLYYEKYLIDGQQVGIGNLLAAVYENGDQTYRSFYYKSDSYNGYFDQNGSPMQKAFLKSPVRFGRLSSRYDLRRLHPIKRRVIPHKGTDYAAPHGTPIMAVADGTITKRGFTRGNGNYIKMRHDKIYETQYLHMSKFAKGIKPGVAVKQGETIGYVGQTGLATGPHVCFRFWKNGKQVNHLRENLPPPKPMKESELPHFFKVRDSLALIIDTVEYPKQIKEPVLSPVVEEEVGMEVLDDI